jgi:hypothetical protein
LALRYTSQKFFHRYYITKVGAPLMSWLFMYTRYILAPSEVD